MKNTKTIHFDEVGPVLFERKRGARYLKIVVEPFVGTRVVMPWWATYREAKEMIYEQTPWILQEQIKLVSLETDYQKKIEELPLIQKEDSRRELKKRLQDLAHQHHFNYRKVFFKNQKTVWGSCSESNNINLNLRLIFLPDELIDYVLLHELVHTEVKNHGARFWQVLSRYVAEPKIVDKHLQDYSWLLSCPDDPFSRQKEPAKSLNFIE